MWQSMIKVVPDRQLSGKVTPSHFLSIPQWNNSNGSQEHYLVYIVKKKYTNRGDIFTGVEYAPWLRDLTKFLTSSSSTAPDPEPVVEEMELGTLIMATDRVRAYHEVVTAPA